MLRTYDSSGLIQLPAFSWLEHCSRFETLYFRMETWTWKHCNSRIVRETRAILAWPCVVLLAQRAKQCYKIWYLWPCWCSSERQNKEYCKESVRDRQAGSGLWHRIYSIVVQQHCFIQLHAGRNSLRCWLVCCPMIFICCCCCLVTLKTI